MELKLINSKEAEKSRYFSTRVEEHYQINSAISVKVNSYVAIHQALHTDLHNLEIQDWETTYFIGGEKCKHDGVKELLNKLFTDLSYDKIEDQIKSASCDERRLADLFPEYEFIQSLSKNKAKLLLETLLPEVKTTINDNVEFIFDWELKQIAKIAEDDRLQTIPCLSDYDLQRIKKGFTAKPSYREVIVINKN